MMHAAEPVSAFQAATSVVKGQENVEYKHFQLLII